VFWGFIGVRGQFQISTTIQKLRLKLSSFRVILQTNQIKCYETESEWFWFNWMLVSLPYFLRRTHTHTHLYLFVWLFFAGGYQFFVFVYFLLFSLKLKKWCISLFCSLIEKNTHDFFAHHLDFWVFSEIMMVFHELIKSLKVSCCFVCFPLVVNFFSVFLIKCEFLTCFGAAMTKFVLFFWPMKKLPFSLIGSSFWKISWSGASAYASV